MPAVLAAAGFVSRMRQSEGDGYGSDRVDPPRHCPWSRSEYVVAPYPGNSGGRRETVMRDKRLILGVIKRVARNENRLIGQVQPLFEAGADLSSWVHEYTEKEVVEEFPNRGLVSWVAAPPSLELGTLWQFRIEDQDFDRQNR